MSQIDGLKRYLEAGLALTQITRARAEELVRELIQTGEVERTRAQEWVEDLMTTSRQRSEAFISTVRDEVRTQLSEVGVTNLDELAKRVAHILDRTQEAARKATKRAGKRAPKRAPVRKAAAKKAPAKKAPAKKKAAAKKAPVKKKVAAKRAPAKKTAVRRGA